MSVLSDFEPMADPGDARDAEIRRLRGLLVEADEERRRLARQVDSLIKQATAADIEQPVRYFSEVPL